MNRSAFLFASVLCFLAVTVSADIHIKQQTTNISGKGKKEKTETEETTVWIASDKMASIGAETSLIIRLDRNVAYSIDHKKRKYVEIPLSILEEGGESEGQQDAAGLPGMFANMVKMKVTVEPTGETKKIRKWNCTKYNQTVEMMGGKTESEMWATEDIKVSQDLVRKFTSALMAQNPAMKQLGSEMMKEAEKMKGYVVSSSSTSKMMGQEIRTTTEVLEMSEAGAPEGVYEVPKKYKKKKYE